MNKLKKESLFWKNVRGVFFGGYKLADPLAGENNHYLAPFAFLLHTALLPITLTLGAGIKTLVDIATRNTPVSSNQISQTSERIKQLDENEINDLAQVITQYHPSSVSSKRLRKTVKEMDVQEAILKKIFLNGKYAEYKAKKEKEFEAQLNDSSTLVKYTLKDIDVKNIKEIESKNINKITTSKTELIRNSIQRYLISPGNNGKKLHCLLMSSILKKQQPNSSDEKTTVEIIVDTKFEERVRDQIRRLRKNGEWWFGIGNNAKAARIEKALEKFKREKNADSFNELKSALDERRLGRVTKVTPGKDFHTESYNRVFRSS
jgi:hypothetical protein